MAPDREFMKNEPNKPEKKKLKALAAAKLFARKLVTEPFAQSRDVESMGASWSGGSVHMHAGTCGGEEVLMAKMRHARTGNETTIGMTLTGMRTFIKVGSEMLARIDRAKVKRN